MSVEIPRPVLKGSRALVVGIANEHSIAYGCAKAFREVGADLAITYLNEKARPHVEPLARSLEAPLFLPLDVAVPGQLEAVFDAVSRQWGGLDILVHSIAFAPKEDLQGGLIELLGGGLRQGDGRLLPLVRADGAACGAADAKRRNHVRDELSRRQQGGAHVQRHGSGQGRARSVLPLPRL